MGRFEQSTEEDRCDKGISWIQSCRECMFEVLCKFNPCYKKDDHRQKQKDTLGDIHKSNGVPKTCK